MLSRDQTLDQIFEPESRKNEGTLRKCLDLDS